MRKNNTKLIIQSLIGVIIIIMIGVLFHYFIEGLKVVDIRPSYNTGGYYLTYLKQAKDQRTDSTVIFGTVYDVDSKEPLVASIVHFFCETSIADNDGRYSFLTKPNSDVKAFLKVRSLGYKGVLTEQFSINSDSVRIDFYLQQDDTPIFHCDSVTNQQK